MKAFCGEALCKAPVAVTASSDGPWPIRCGACGTALYPDDVLSRLPPNELEPRRGKLMKERKGKRVALSSRDLPKAPAGSMIDRILAMVDLGPSEARTVPPARPTKAAPSRRRRR